MRPECNAWQGPHRWNSEDSLISSVLRRMQTPLALFDRGGVAEWKQEKERDEVITAPKSSGGSLKKVIS